MGAQTVFKRYELKYLLTENQKEAVMAAVNQHMQSDPYGDTVIRNIYFDTDNYRLIRRSMEKPIYKEKLRLRSYARVHAGEPVFVELKKKYRSVVYKRRILMPEDAAMNWLRDDGSCPMEHQIADEIDYFRSFYGDLRPVVFLSYHRNAYIGGKETDLRVTFDDRILCRQEALTLNSEPWGTEILPSDRVLMEIKCSGGIPLWMTEVLTREKIQKTSFSKYGTAYEKLIFPNVKEAIVYGGRNF